MKKFLAAFDGLHFSESTLRYAIDLSLQCKAHLVGVFLEDFTRRSYGLAEIAHYAGEDVDRRVHELDEKDETLRRESIDKFEEACQSFGLNYSIHRDRNVALQEILEESIYADLLIIHAGETLTRFEEEVPTRFVRELLNDAQCPVLLVPNEFRPFQKIVLLYDGEPSSVYAVRTFSYLFEAVKDMETEVLTVKAPNDTLHLPHNQLMKEFIRRHYPKAEYIVLKGQPEEEIIRYLLRQKTENLLVLGAYRRQRLSRLFRPSMADRLLQQLNTALFIAHNKS